MSKEEVDGLETGHGKALRFDLGNALKQSEFTKVLSILLEQGYSLKLDHV